jgi:ADP-L-glycero-D-manno-heptose 6-epimerase
MNSDSTILLTGAAGFIGSCMLGHLNDKRYKNIIIVDDFGDKEKETNYSNKHYSHQVERHDLFEWLKNEDRKIDFVFHLGARTDTTEFDYSIHQKLNVEFSQKIWAYCTEHKVPLVYASSAATYGSGELGYADSHEIVDQLKPLNPYGVSKNEFDKWALGQDRQPPRWAGLKFFNVYGPNEYHKDRMASVIFHSFNQVAATGKVRLFKSHRDDFKDGEQLRDFIYVTDVVKVCHWFMEVFTNAEKHSTIPLSGLYNLGTGKARTFNDLVTAIFNTLGKQVNIQYVDTPEDIRDKYQYFTEADMRKLRTAGYSDEFVSLEEGVKDYVTRYLSSGAYL